MKSFRELLEEKNTTHKPVVMAFGRMNPPTTGHLKLIDKVRSEAEKRGAKHTVIVSHSQDSKKNPLSGAQKVKHLKRYSPGTHFEASSKEHPTIMHHAAKLNAAGHDHLIVVAGSDRVKEYHDLLHKYNGKADKHGNVPYNFKKIEVVSAGHRDPDAEGAEGMSGTKMREHAKNNDFHSFREGVPHHVSDNHVRELMKDTRKGMGLHEQVDRGQFKAIFVTGGPGSGKDVIIREAIAEGRAVELNFVQAFEYLADKQALSEKTDDFRKESIRNRGPLIINGPADDMNRVSYINEELVELGYETMMIFVETSNEESKNRNESLKRMMLESVRQDKWIKSVENRNHYTTLFETFAVFDNNGSILEKEEDISDIYHLTNNFFECRIINETALYWLESKGKLNINEKFNLLIEKDHHAEKNSKFIQRLTEKRGAIKLSKSGLAADGPNDITPDNRAGDANSSNVKWDANKRTKTYTFGSGPGVYAEEGPSIKVSPIPKEPNFQKDKDKNKRLKFGDKSLSAAKVGKPPGVGPEYDTRAGGQGAAAGAGLGQNLYGEDSIGATASNADVMNFSAQTKGPQPNPLAEKKPFNKFRKMKEAIDDPGIGDSGVGGVLGGAARIGKNEGTT